MTLSKSEVFSRREYFWAPENVIKGSIVFTDEYKGYSGLLGKDFEHETVNHYSRQFVNVMASTNGIESVWAVLKRENNGVYHNWSEKHMRQYIKKFSFQLNEGNCKVDAEDRLDALFRAMTGKTITFEELTF